MNPKNEYIPGRISGPISYKYDTCEQCGKTYNNMLDRDGFPLYCSYECMYKARARKGTKRITVQNKTNKQDAIRNG